jgi:iron complex outermembrane receptor protein
VFTAYDSDGDGSRDAFFGDFRNAGRGRARGAELELQLALAAGLRIEAQAAWLDTRYDEYLTANAAGEVVDIASAQRFTNAPRHSAGLALLGEWDTAGHRIDGRLGLSWQDTTYPTTDLAEALRQGAHGLWSAQVRWDPPGPWSLSLSGHNLGDRRYRTTGFLIEATGVLVAYHGPPRTLALSLRHDF